MMAETAGGASQHSLMALCFAGTQHVSLGKCWKGSRLAASPWPSAPTQLRPSRPPFPRPPPEVEESPRSRDPARQAGRDRECETVDLEVLTNAEIILRVATLSWGNWRAEGPFGDHTGFYTLEDEYPAGLPPHLQVTHRKDPIYAATIVGKLPMERTRGWAEPSPASFCRAMKISNSELVDIHLPVEAVLSQFDDCVRSGRAIPARRAR